MVKSGSSSNKKFSIIIPAELSKSKDGDWRVKGLASTASRDLQGEFVDQNGLDLTPIDMKKGVFNWDHQKGPENILGAIDGYKKTGKGLYVEGRLFKNHQKAKAVYEIMSSLNKSDQGRVGMSIEGVIKERSGPDNKHIKKAVINSCALTMNPVNTETYVDLIKSMGEVQFEATKENLEDLGKESTDEPMFTANQVVSIIEKALGVGSGYTQAPEALTGGDALAQESLDKKKKKKKMKKMSTDMYKANIIGVLDNLQKLYPEYSRTQLFWALRDRLETRFPKVDS